MRLSYVPLVLAVNVRSRQKTLENRLEEWGFTLNREIRKRLIEDLRKQVADLVKDDCKTPFP